MAAPESCSYIQSDAKEHRHIAAAVAYGRSRGATVPQKMLSSVTVSTDYGHAAVVYGAITRDNPWAGSREW